MAINTYSLLLALFFFNTIVVLASDVAYFFNSRPDLAAPKLTVHFRDDLHISAGYIFMGITGIRQPGGYIYDSYGELVWTSFGSSVSSNVDNVHVCAYQGEPHMCFFQGKRVGGRGFGHNVIMNHQYETVKTIQAYDGADMHEFALLENGKTALQTSYQVTQIDLTKYNVSTGVGWVDDCLFREIDVRTSRLIFEWHSLEKVSLSEGVSNPVPTGQSHIKSWDYFHINSVEKNREGNYLVSSRHTSTIYKVNQKGEIIWRLSSEGQSSFRVTNFRFAGQHHARWHSENATHTTLTFFNNGRTPHSSVTTYSHGIKVLLDHTLNTATQIREYAAQGSDNISGSLGSLQTLQNENVFISWGEIPHISEHLEDGTPIFFATLDRGSSYRSFRFKWNGSPQSPPALWTFAHSPNAKQTVAYMSWNGATEVFSWKLYTVASEGGEETHTLAGYSIRTGFETNITISGFHTRTFVEAAAANGSSLGNSSIVSTFVPGSNLAAFCTDVGCLSEEFCTDLGSAEVWEVEPCSKAQNNTEVNLVCGLETVAATHIEVLWAIRLFLLLCIVLLMLGCLRLFRLALSFKPAKKYQLVQQEMQIMALEDEGR